MKIFTTTDELDALPNFSILLVGVTEGDDLDAAPCQKVDDVWYGIGWDEELGYPNSEAFENGLVRLLWVPEE